MAKMSHLITTSLCCHNGASTALNGAYLPPQEFLFTHCHHSRPSLPQNVMVSEVPLSSHCLCASVSPSHLEPQTWRNGLLVGRWGWPLGLLQRRLLQVLFWGSIPLAKANQTPGGSGREGATGGLIVLPFITQTSGPDWTLSTPYSHTHSKGQCPHKVTAPIGRGMHLNWRGSKKRTSKPTTWEYLIGEWYFFFLSILVVWKPHIKLYVIQCNTRKVLSNYVQWHDHACIGHQQWCKMFNKLSHLFIKMVIPNKFSYSPIWCTMLTVFLVAHCSLE